MKGQAWFGIAVGLAVLAGCNRNPAGPSEAIPVPDGTYYLRVFGSDVGAFRNCDPFLTTVRTQAIAFSTVHQTGNVLTATLASPASGSMKVELKGSTTAVGAFQVTGTMDGDAAYELAAGGSSSLVGVRVAVKSAKVTGFVTAQKTIGMNATGTFVFSDAAGEIGTCTAAVVILEGAP